MWRWIVQRQEFDSGTWAVFSLADIACPSPLNIVSEIGPELTVRGQIAYFSDCGDESDHFAVIRVEGIYAPVIVPVARLRHAGLPISVGAADARLDCDYRAQTWSRLLDGPTAGAGISEDDPAAS